MEKYVPEECSFCHRYQQKISREVSFYFPARFSISQAACQQLHDLFSKLSRLLTCQALELLSLLVHHLMGSQLFLWLLVWITEWLAAGSPKLPSVLLTGFLPFFYLAPQMPFSTDYLGPHVPLVFEAWLLRVVYCPSSWLPGG